MRVDTQDLDRTLMRDNEGCAGFYKITERMSNWQGHVMRRDEEHTLRKVFRTDIPGKRREIPGEMKGG